MILETDLDERILVLSTEGNSQTAFYSLAVVRYDDDGEQEFYHDEIALPPADRAYLDIGDWHGDQDSLQLQIDADDNGTIDDVIELIDEFGPAIGDEGPSLSATRLGADTIEISWETGEFPLILESSMDLNQGWTTISGNQISDGDGTRSITIDTASNNQSYYRLRAE